MGSVPAINNPAIAPGMKMMPSVFRLSIVGINAALMLNRPNDSKDCFDVAPSDNMVSIAALLSLTSRTSLSIEIEQIDMAFPKAIPDNGTMNWGCMGIDRDIARTDKATVAPVRIDGVVIFDALGIPVARFAEVYPLTRTMVPRSAQMMIYQYSAEKRKVRNKAMIVS